jgi:phosphopantetheine adenylyltransferase
MFHVQGFKFNGWVKCVYDLGADLFNIFYIDNMGETQKIQKGIYFDELVDTIDREVEKVENYNQRVKELYSWINR